MKNRAYFVRFMFIALAFFVVCATFATYAEAKTAGEINASVNAATEPFLQTGGWRKGVHVPGQGSIGDAECDKGRVFCRRSIRRRSPENRRQNAGYYNLVAGSFGFTFGAQRMDIIIAFMTDEALQGFRKVGWLGNWY